MKNLLFIIILSIFCFGCDKTSQSDLNHQIADSYFRMGEQCALIAIQQNEEWTDMWLTKTNINGSYKSDRLFIPSSINSIDDNRIIDMFNKMYPNAYLDKSSWVENVDIPATHRDWIYLKK